MTLNRFAIAATFAALSSFASAAQALVVAQDRGASGIANDAALVDGATITTDAHTGAGALSSTGRGRASIGGDLTELDIDTATGVSFMAWMKTPDIGNHNGILMLGACCDTRNGYSLQIQSDGNLRFWGGSDVDNSNYNTSTYGFTLDDGDWHHVGVRFDASGLNIMVDGARAASGTAPRGGSSPSAAVSSGSTARMGAAVPYIGGPQIDAQVSGKEMVIDEVNIFSGYLSDADWQAAMNGGRVGDLAYFAFDDGVPASSAAVSAVPLPAAAPMLIAGAAALLGFGRKGRRRA